MPTLPSVQPRPIKADPTRPGRSEAERQAALMARSAGDGQRFPGDGGRTLPPEGQTSRPRKG